MSLLAESSYQEHIIDVAIVDLITNIMIPKQQQVEGSNHNKTMDTTTKLWCKNIASTASAVIAAALITVVATAPSSSTSVRY